jgi:serine/threonine protein kinase
MDQFSCLAAPGAILLTESLLLAVLAQLPANWEITEQAEDSPRKPLPGLEPASAGPHKLIGPNVRATPELAAFRFRCVGQTTAGVTVYCVDRPERGDDLAARDLYSSPQSKRLGRYHLTSLIGRGATAEVWRAHTDEGEIVAIKRLRDGATASEQHQRRFEREAAILSRLDHPNICRVREMHAIDEDRFIAMDYIEGATLAEILVAISVGSGDMEAGLHFTDLAALVNCVEHGRREAALQTDEPQTTARSRYTPAAETLPVAQALTLMKKIALAVDHAHQQGILHRDLKPANILVRPDGEPVVTDFGLAKLISPHNTSISLADQILGTLEYMAPEQARASREVDERADIYALGAILYELLTGRRAFIGSGHLLHDAERLQTHQPIPPREVAPHLDPSLEFLVLHALRQRPAERYASVAEFLADLERYESGEALHAQPPSLRARAAAVADALLRRFS